MSSLADLPETLFLHAAVRIEALEDGRFRVDHLTSRRRWEVGSEAFAVLAEFAGGAAARAVIADAPRSSATAVESWIGEAARAGILVVEDDPDHLAALTLRREWEANGWAFASEYQLATFSFPFLDYATDGAGADTERMVEYMAAERDPGIAPSCDEAPGIALRPARSVCEGLLPIPLPGNGSSDASLDREALVEVLSATFGELRLGEGDSRTRVRRTSPSGGARHPVEGYILALDVAGLAVGAYHCCWRRGELHPLGDVPLDEATVRAACPWFYRFGEPGAIVLVTAVLERNMYRYREPRTLRTIFMDAGHLCSTLELLCAARDLPALVHHGIDDRRVEELLGLDPLSEAAIAGVAIGVSE
ncbi:MAG TPA: SagB/ThcOx family dehydrogenase [Solirubrobacterales bacterium]